MLTVTFHNPNQIDDSLLKYAVICARHQGQWLFSRHKQRSTWEIPGGHRESGEKIEDTARRELWEETGCADADLRLVCVYAVNRDGIPTYGMLFFAEVNSLGGLPETSEIGKVRAFDYIPEELTYPAIQPHLFEKIQGWLNVQSAAGELWDVYDADRNRTGKLHRRGEELLPGEYHLVVHVWMQNSRGEFLMTKRSPNKGFPNLWETTGGSALTGDDSLTAALREVKEETGLTLNPDLGQVIHRYSGSDYHTDVWLFRQDYDLADVVLQPGETSDKRYASREELLADMEQGKIVPYSYLKEWMETGFLLSIREAEREDTAAAAKLACLLWPHNTQQEMELEFAPLIAGQESAVFLAEANGEAIGFAQCQLRHDYVEGTDSSPVGYLEGIIVREEYRRKGIAKRLLRACEDWAKGAGCIEFASDCELDNYDSFRFHLAMGFLEANRIICFTKKIGE